MLGRLLGRVRSLWEPDDTAETGRFRPSLLDRSVLFAHGSGREDVDRELREISENARELEEHRGK